MRTWNDYATTKPESAGRYLVAGYDGINERTVIMRWNEINKRWVQTGVLAHITVTHWMPLPAPPDVVDNEIEDAIEVVRCAECKHLVPYGGIVGIGAYECERLKTSRTGIFPPMGFYCAWGEKIERKDEAPDA